MISSNRFIIAFGGPKGVGKSTLLQNLILHYPHVQVVPVGRELNRLAQSKFHKSFLRISIKERLRVRLSLAHRIIKKRGSVILDMHFGEFEDEGYPCSIPSMLRKRITHCILIIASPEIILKRRQLRVCSSRLDMTSIVLNIDGERAIFQELVKRYKLPGLMVKNENRRKCILDLKKYFKRIGII